MSKDPHKLPEGWEWTKIGVIYDIVGGGTPSTEVEEYWNGDIPWITSADIYSLKDYRPRKQITKVAIENSATNLVPEGSLIVVTRVGLGKVTLAKIPLCFSQDSQALIDHNSIVYPDYALYYLSQATQIFKYENRGTTIAGITKKQLSELLFALPPLPEQQRIVEAIEQQFSRLDEGLTLLRQSQRRLKSYRASVLKAAVEGELTAGWREAHPDTEPASELLKRILAERRAKWEEEQIAKGKDLEKIKYVEPAGPDVKRLPKLPEGWCWATVEQVADVIGGVTKGRNLAGRSTTVLPYLRVANVQRGYVDVSIMKSIEIPEDEIDRYLLHDGDIVLTEGGDADKLGRAAIWKSPLEVCIHQNHIFRARLINQFMPPQWFVYYANSELGRAYFLKAAKQTVNLASINLTQLRSCHFPLPPPAEQEQIISLVEERLSIIDNLEATIETALKHADRLRQSILHQAFTGKLVPQDPDDEPASMLLERIRAEREESAPKEQKKTKRARKKVAPTRVVNVSDEPPEPIDTEAMMQGNLWESIEA